MIRPRVTIIGGGFAGLQAARALRKAAVDITLVDRRNFHLFQPLLYQVATGGLSPGNIAAPLRAIVRRQRNCEVVLGEVTGFDLDRQRVILAESELPYDLLLVCTGTQTGYFGKDEWATRAPGLKSIEDALEIRSRVLTAFEAAEQESDPALRKAWLTFVIVGGGPTGVELAGTLAEIARYTMQYEFRHMDPTEARILLIDLAPRILGSYAEPLSAEAQRRLESMRVEVRLHTRIVELNETSVVVQTGEQQETIAARTTIWAAGVEASPLGKALADAAGCEVDRMGRVKVEPDLTLRGHPEVFVMGDLAHCVGSDGKPLPGVAPAAIQQGYYVADTIRARQQARILPPFRYKDLGSMATIGRRAAVAQISTWQFRGVIAWLMWLFIHLIQLVRFESRVLVLIQWAWNYFTFSRSTRLITGVASYRSRLSKP